MATSNELVYGRFGKDHDALLRQCDDLMPSWLNDDTYPTGIVARLIWLDQQRGIDSSDNAIYMAAGYAVWLHYCVEILDEELKRILDTEDESSAAGARVAEIWARGFKVKFTLPEAVGQYPDWIRGQERTVRVLSEKREQSSEFPPVFTAKPDGKRLGV